jgi:hypothetical protein
MAALYRCGAVGVKGRWADVHQGPMPSASSTINAWGVYLLVIAALRGLGGAFFLS